jgi:DNA-binding beta-propeller fold protein YncE
VGAGVLKKPINIAIDADGTRFVTDTERSLVVVFDREDRFVRTLGEPGAFRPVGIAVAAGQLYVSDIEHHQVLILDKTTGSVLSKFGQPGSQAGELYQPTNIALAADGSVLVSDTGNFRIQKFTADGRFVRSYGEIGTAPGKFARPKGVAIDRAGRMYVVDAAFENLQVLDPEGVPLLYFGAPGSARDSINLPTTVTVDYANVELFRKYAAPGFELEYVVLVACQFGANKVAVFGFGSVARSRSGAATVGKQPGGR